MIKKNQTKILLLSASIIVFVITKLMWWTIFVSAFLTFSLPLLFILGKTKGRKKIFAIITWLLIIWIDFFLLLLLLIPTQSYNIETKKFYEQKYNYMKIYIKDSKDKVKWMLLKIKKWNNNWITLPLTKYKKWERIKLSQNTKIYFVWMKSYKTYAVIYLWDDTIIRLTPWTRINLTKITKNLNDITDNQTHISLKQWNIWFHVLKMIKNSNNMKIETWKWQELIIRWTAWLVSKNNKKTTVIWYSHFIEIKDKNNSKIISKWEWAIVKNNEIKITHNIKNLLNTIWINDKLIKEFKIEDKKYIENMQKKLLEYIKKQVWTLKKFKFYNKLLEWKIKIFSIWDKNYKKYLQNLINYKYLVWEWKKFTAWLANNSNLVFIASELEKQKAKTAYLYEQVKNDIQNNDLYKTFVINLWIEGKIKDINKTLQENINTIIQRYWNNYDKIFEDIDNWTSNFINKYLNF